ncbi:hypothetical protein RhiirA4_509121 [Rhizophagus irregularis]|uniref:Uncharacterized protein n=1 Tax=Rhizophagus irregularis TaxID=588596 RepID=A0A2I1HE22_9GLOM|nr:hypothetical protein RhiirA4_509121 [Rhizophagus irregularis]
MVNKKKNRLTERDLYKLSEKELYSKICVAQSIKPVVNEARNEVVDDIDKNCKLLSCSLATIFARDREVIAVKLKISDGYIAYISKNGPWLDKDVVYINKIEEYLRNMSKDSSKKSKANPDALTSEVLSYCSNKLESRIKKLKKDLTRKPDKEYIKSFIKYASAKLEEFDPKKLNDVDKSKISVLCHDYYKQLDGIKKSETPQKFLGHLRKVGSYVASAIILSDRASDIKYKNLFSNIELRMIKPIIITNNQPIYSWEYVIKSFVRNHVDYVRFKDECLDNEHIVRRLRKVYSDGTGQLKLDNRNIETHVYIHAELNILASMIDQEDKSKTFIAVSKRCCYLCEQYIGFLRKQGYDIIISGEHGKIYLGWKLPQVASINFRIRSLNYLLEKLGRVIERKINYQTRSLDADSDSNVSDSLWEIQQD